MLKEKMSKYLLTGGMALTGLVVGIGAVASAQSINTQPTTTPVVQTANTSASTSVDTPESANDPADSDATDGKEQAKPGDGTVSSINGSTIVVTADPEEGGASYTVDASKASVVDDSGAKLTLADIKVGSEVEVKGSVSGTNIAATSISLGNPNEAHDAETNDDAGGAQDVAD